MLVQADKYNIIKIWVNYESRSSIVHDASKEFD